MTMDKTIAAGEFKAKCLNLLNEVARQRASLARYHQTRQARRQTRVPIDDEPVTLFGRMAGTIRILGDIVSSPLDEAEWGDGDAKNVFGDDDTP